MNKKGISLIVLVITIIVMIIIAGAIILSLSSSNVTQRANLATLMSDRANYQAKYATVLAERTTADNPSPDVTSADLGFKSNDTRGEWTLVSGEVKFKIASEVDAYKTYGLEENQLATGAYSWLSK